MTPTDIFRRAFDHFLNAAVEVPVGLGGQTPMRSTASQLIPAHMIASLPEASWLIEDIIGTRSFSLLYGPSNGYKSFLALDLACHLATARDWKGRTTTGGNVVYVLAEGNEGQAARQTAIETKLQLHPHRGLQRLFYWDRPLNLLNGTEIEEFVIQTGVLDPALVILDPLAQCTPGMDENSAKDMGSAVAAINTIRTRTEAAVLVVHHSGKKGGRERGSSALTAAADTVMRLLPQDGGFRLICQEQRHARKFAPIELGVEPVADSLVVVERSIQKANSRSAATKHPPQQKVDVKLRRKKMLELVPEKGITSGEWSQAYIAAGLGSISTFYRDRKWLESEGLVRETQGANEGFYERLGTLPA